MYLPVIFLSCRLPYHQQAISSPFHISVCAPSSCGLMEATAATLRIRSFQPSLERVRVNVVPNDAFLVAGTTLSVLEVSGPLATCSTCAGSEYD